MTAISADMILQDYSLFSQQRRGYSAQKGALAHAYKAEKARFGNSYLHHLYIERLELKLKGNHLFFAFSRTLLNQETVSPPVFPSLVMVESDMIWSQFSSCRSWYCTWTCVKLSSMLMGDCLAPLQERYFFTQCCWFKVPAEMRTFHASFQHVFFFFQVWASMNFIPQPSS